VQLEQDPILAGPWHQLFKQVQSPRHVVSELLQNADDAGATMASANIKDGEFIFTHNGEDFTEEHFTSLCRFGYSNKRSLHTIGFRGIGFKSTFSLGDQVRLVTPTLSVAFNRERFTEPVWVGETGQSSATSIRVIIKDQRRQGEIEKNLSEWLHSPASLLFFRHIRTLRIGDEEVEWVSLGAGPVADSEWMSLSSNPDKKYLLIRSQMEKFPAEALEEIKQERMVSNNEESSFPPCRVEIVLGMEGRLFVILPTGVTANLPFACNAPFVQDPARLKIKDPDISPTNRWLLGRAGGLAAHAMMAWVSNDKLDVERRTQAYRLLSDVDREDSSLEGSCAAIVEQAIDDTIRESKFLIAETGDLISWGECRAVPDLLLNVWSNDQVVSFFADQKRSILSRYVSIEDRQKLIHWGAVESVEKSRVIDVLESKHLPRPNSWRQLMMLWAYLSSQVIAQRYIRCHTGVKIVPVQGRDVLYAADEVVRLGEKKLLHSEEDWNFLAERLLVLNQNWPRFLAEQRRKAEDCSGEASGQEVESAYDLLEKLKLTQASDVSEVIQQVASDFFGQSDCDVDDCIRLAQIAASLGATVSESFQFVTRDGYRKPVKDCIVADVQNDLDAYVDIGWYKGHVLHDGYNVMRSCTEDEWQQWVTSGRSNLVTFVPLIQFHHQIWGYQELRKTLKTRGFENKPYLPYVTNNFILEDWDFIEEHWQYWSELAAKGMTTWGLLFTQILKRPTSFWSKSTNAKILQVATTGNTRALTQEPLLPSWIIKFRTLPCLQDTRGNYRQPAELLRRTPNTESLLDVEPFVRAEFDTEATRQLLCLLGVRDTPSGPDRLLDRLRALATVDNPPVYEVEKWYHRLDQLVDRCSTQEFQTIKEAFNNEKIILTEGNSWSNAAEVFLAADEVDVPGAALVHPSVRHLAIWLKVGVANRPTVNLAIDWLTSLEPGQSLTVDELRRVRSLMPRYPERIWSECGHWLNLEGEWTPTEELVYSLTMQTLVAWRHLFKPIKQKTADLQKLSADVCDQHPFATLRSLSQSIEDRFEDHLSHLPDPQKRPWLNALGSGLRRLVLDDQNDTQRVRELAHRLTVTHWQPALGLQTVPYIDGTPSGTPRRIDVLWKESLLYVEDRSTAKMAKVVAQELGRVFNKQEIADAIKLCYDRTPEFVLEYLEENFNLMPEAQIDTIGGEACKSRSDDNGQKDVTAQDNQARAQITTHNEPQQTEEGGAIANEEKGNTGVENEQSEDADVNATSESGELGENGEDGESAAAPRRHHPRPARPSLIERFAAANGYARDNSEGRFYHKNGGWLERVSGNSFPWERYSSSGELLQCYWIKDACIEREPLQVEADVWELCAKHPEKYSLLLAAPDGTPVEYSGERICSLRDRGQLTLFPASYRLVYEHNVISEEHREAANGGGKQHGNTAFR
jgi:hypothetical protein